MKQLIMGTRNLAKVAQVAGALAPLEIEVVGLPEEAVFPDVEETGTAPENARKKAIIYSMALGVPVLSMDNALYFPQLPDDEQPGVNVRRIKGDSERVSDQEMLDYYSKLIEGLGGFSPAYWEFALCYAYPDGVTRETTIKLHRIFTSKVSDQIVEGYPLESIQIDPKTCRCIAEMSQIEQDDFWQRSIGDQLCKFMQGIINQ